MKSRSLPALIAASFAIFTLATCTNGSPERGVHDWRSPQRSAQADAYSSFLVGRFASLTNDPREAARNYADALSDAPADAGLTERAVFAALLSGDVTTALRVAEKADYEILETASLARITLGVARMRAGRSKSAIEYFTDGEAGPFNTMIAEGLTAWALLDDEDYDAAEAALMQGQMADSLREGVVLYTKGLMLISEGKDAAALAIFDELWNGGARFAVAAEVHAQLLAADGQETRAIQILTAFADEVGLNPAIERLRADLEAGRSVSVKRLNAKEGGALAIYAPAAALATQTQGDVAGVYFALALALDPELDVARTLWGKALDDAGRRDDAIEVLEGVPETSPFYASARGQIAWALRREDRNDQALLVAAEALAAHPDRDLKIQLGDLYRSLERHGEAEQIFNEIVTKDNEIGRTDWRLLYARGAEREQLERWPEAEIDLKAALALQPESADILNYLGYSWIDRNMNLDEGLELIRKAVALRPNSGYIVDSLGWAHYRLGHYDRAVIYLEDAVGLTPQDAVLNEHLGDAYWQVGRRLEAAFQWNRALTLEPDAATEAMLNAKLEHGLVDNLSELAARLYEAAPVTQNP